MPRAGVIAAVAQRELFSYFGSPTGYVFITLFVFLSAVAAFWQERFFLNNLCNLDQLNAWFPYLLVFLVPAITMGLWAEERRQGTEELILTLPARDSELVLGKYFAGLAIYTVALVFSLSHVVVLSWLGSPDAGMLAATYAGYWLLGASLLPLGLLASQLTANLTVAFILGAALCGLPVFLRQAGAIVTGGAQRLAEQLSAVEQFRDLADGVVTTGSLVYFAALAAAVLYLNVKLAGRPRWRAKVIGLHYAVRACALVAAAFALSVIAGRAGARLDVTSEQVHSLSPDTKKLIQSLDAKRPVSIQAYLSPEVPRAYLDVRNNLLQFLREFAALGRERVNVRIVETVKYSPEAREARERYGIEPFRVAATEESASSVNEIFLALVFTCGAEEFVIPAFDRGLPVEYELMRSIRVVSKAGRRRVGILQTPARLFGGFDFQARRQSPEWSIVAELKKQYEVSEVSADTGYPDNLDVVIAALPHALNAAQVSRLKDYADKGKAVMILVDPLPAFNLQLSPQAEEDRSPADLRPLLRSLGIDWDSNRVVWDTYNPHPQLRSLPPEAVFAGKDGFSAADPVSSGLQEAVLLYPGMLKSRNDEKLKVTPLIETGKASGTLRWSQLVQRSIFGTAMAQGLPHKPDGETYMLAARVKGPGRNAVVVADVDIIGEEFFQIRRRGVENMNFDNVTFALNAVDSLAGDEGFIALRKRRPKHRTLEAVEARTREFEAKRDADSQGAAVLAEKRIQEAQARLDAAVATVRARSDLDDQAKQIMIANIESAENRRLQVARTNIEDERRREMEDARARMETSVRGIQNTIKLLAVTLPPIPAFLLFLIMSARKIARERARISTDRLVRPGAETAS
ncbi:MAG: Gldg family protein [Bryobacteraceae bacterium]